MKLSFGFKMDKYHIIILHGLEKAKKFISLSFFYFHLLMKLQSDFASYFGSQLLIVMPKNLIRSSQKCTATFCFGLILKFTSNCQLLSLFFLQNKENAYRNRTT